MLLPGALLGLLRVVHPWLPQLAVGNTMKRVAVVVSSVLFFKNPVSGELDLDSSRKWGTCPD